MGTTVNMELPKHKVEDSRWVYSILTECWYMTEPKKGQFTFREETDVMRTKLNNNYCVGRLLKFLSEKYTQVSKGLRTKDPKCSVKI